MIGIRLQRARKAASISLRTLGEMVGVSQTTIAKYESEESTPDSTMLLELAKALKVKTEFFFRSSEFVLENKEYRKRTISKIELQSIESKILNLVEKRFELEALYPNLNSVQFEVPNGLPKHIQYLYNIDDFANELRHLWDLGHDPIDNLSDLLEYKGIKVFMIDEDADNNFDGLAALVNDYHIIVISKNWPGDRQRFTLAHELGHLMLDGKLADTLDEEKASDRFAGAFLLPQEPLKKNLGEKRKSLEVAELSLIKKEFGVSMQVAFIRASHTKIIDYN